MKYILQQLTTYFKAHKLRYAIVFIFMVIASAMYVAPIYILRLFIDALIQDDFYDGNFDSLCQLVCRCDTFRLYCRIYLDI